MALELRQSLKLTQQLVMTPQLQQAIKLLQMSRMELIEQVREEMEENPILEEGMEEQEERASQEETVEVSSPEQDGVAEVDGSREGLPEIDWQSYLDSYSLGGSAGDFYEETEERPSFESLLTKKGSLTDHLAWQLGMLRLDEDLRRCCAEVIGNLDEKGFLVATLEEIGSACNLATGCVEKALGTVQGFEPAGVAARNLQECLLIQARRLDMGGTVVEEILRDHIDFLENKNYQPIARKLGLSLDEVFAAIKIISSLDPRPGAAFNQEDAHYIIPDIFIHRVSGEYVVTLNDEGLPHLRINSFYRSYLSNKSDVDKQAGEYIQDKVRSALWLIKSIHQRQRTIYKVTKSIVKFQREFLDQGIEYLKPLVLRDVAEDIQMHESTISRVTTNKYVQTPQGLFELKFFFNSGISTADGDAVASASVKSKIKEIIASEDPRKPLSDQKIADMLSESNLEIARRTVTKYREMLGIGSSTERKRMF